MMWLIGMKLLINLGVAATFLRSTPAIALMFSGFAVADAGSLWVILSTIKP